MTQPMPPRDRRGFVLLFVVMMLFAISVASATGYLIVSSEFKMAKYSAEGSEALTVARAGLQRFVAEQIGVVGDSVSYAIGNGVAMVTRRKLMEVDSLNHLYYIRSEGTVTDIFALSSPARRVVGAYAMHRKRPLAHHAAMVVAAEGAWAQDGGGLIDGADYSTPGDCLGGGASAISGAIARTSTGALSGGILNGSPNGETWAGGYSEIYDSVALRWDILSDPNFPIEFDGAPPNFAALPADSFPVVRVSGYFPADGTWSGRGVLIVDGELDAGPSFTWDGIILAGAIDDIHEANIRGILVAGLDGPNSYANVYWRGTIRYFSCFVYAANESLSYLELIEGTLFEAY